MATDMSLGGASFGAGYTPIRFAPLVSLTGPVMAPATPTAPAAPAAPMAPALRLPTMADMPDNAYMTGEMQQGTPGAGFVNPFAGMSGAQIGQKALDALSFFTSPLGFAAQYAMTGKTPSENLSGLFSGGQQQPQVPIGPQMLSEKAQGGVASIGGIGGATYNDALNIASGWGLSSEAANAVGTAAAALVAQGIDPSMAISLALMDASMAASQVPEGAPTPGGPGAPGILGFSPSGNQLLSDIYGSMQFAPGAMQSGPGGASLSEEGGYAPSDGGFTGFGEASGATGAWV